MKEVVSFQSLPHWLSHAIPSTVPRSQPSSSLSCHSTPKVTQEADSSTHQAYSSKYPMKLHTAKARFTRTRSCRFPRTRSCPSPWPVTKQPSFSADFETRSNYFHFSWICLLCELHKKHCPVSSCRRGHFPEVFQHVPTVFPVVLQLLSLALRALEMVALHLLANAHTVGYNDTIMTSMTSHCQHKYKQQESKKYWKVWLLSSSSRLLQFPVYWVYPFDSFRGFTASKNLAI